ncbi:MAG TPA: carbohydrate ABC transporter permease [Chloroflexota bacterium]
MANLQQADTLTATRSGFQDFTKRRSVRTAVWITFLTIVVTLGSIFLLFPVAFMISSSLKTQGQSFLLPIKWIPGVEFPPQWVNYPTALNFMKWTVVYLNTIIVAVGTIVGTVISSTVVAYGFARFRAPGRSVLFGLMLSTLMVPGATLLVPSYIGFSRLGFVNTFWPLILPAWFGSAFNIFLLRQFFTTIPMAMDEAATIDGAGPLRTLLEILVPQIRPAVAVVAIGALTFSWNDFLVPLIYLNSTDRRTAAVALSGFQAVYGGTPLNLLMAASLVMMLPLVVLFFGLQRYFIQGIVITGVKG